MPLVIDSRGGNGERFYAAGVAVRMYRCKKEMHPRLFKSAADKSVYFVYVDSGATNPASWAFWMMFFAC
jgi:hypothetical protein